MELEDFLKVKDQFAFGDLVTESVNPRTVGLSTWAKEEHSVSGPVDGDTNSSDANGLLKALELLQQVDAEAIETLMSPPLLENIEQLGATLQRVLSAGRNVYLTGCGASGRLAVSLGIFSRQGFLGETLCRLEQQEGEANGRIRGFMAGGDVAFIRAVESFEDQTEYGARQLTNEQFSDGDMLVAFSAAGAAPFVVGACHEALRHPGSIVAFVYCNPDDVLCRVSERSRSLLTHPSVLRVNVNVGPMAITGSTRMQAATAQLLAVGLALQFQHFGAEEGRRKERIKQSLLTLHSVFSRPSSSPTSTALNYGALATLTRLEANWYTQRNWFYYEACDSLCATVLTDVTERAPTFSVAPFENLVAPKSSENKDKSCVYMRFPAARDSNDAWVSLLHRGIHSVEWADKPNVLQAACKGTTLQYDMSPHGTARYRPTTTSLINVQWCPSQSSPEGMGYLVFVGARNPKQEEIQSTGNNELAPREELCRCRIVLPPAVDEDPFLMNVVAKCLLNAHSTSVMARLGRVSGNVMLFVRPSNFKLIDRAARYCLALLAQRRPAGSVPPHYDDVVRRILQLSGNSSHSPSEAKVEGDESRKGKRAVLGSEDSIVLGVVESLETELLV